MSNIRRIIVVVLVAAVFSLGAAGCKSGGRADHADHQGEPQKKTEQPKPDHPKH